MPNETMMQYCRQFVYFNYTFFIPVVKSFSVITKVFSSARAFGNEVIRREEQIDITENGIYNKKVTCSMRV